MRKKWISLACLALVSPGLGAQPRWQPAKTRVLVASITSWPASAGLDSFNGTRRDGDLVEQFRLRGVPEDHLIFLKDSQATRESIRSSLSNLAARCRPDETLIFYFQGHGGRKLLYCYDYDKTVGDASAVAMREIAPLLSGWKGQRLFLIGDCCCSGSLSSVVQDVSQSRPDARVAAFGSATASNLSTGNWTYTEGLLRVLSGDPLCDSNRDGQINLQEAQNFLHNQMKYKEDQLCSLTLSPNFETNYCFSDDSGAPPPHLTGPYQVGDLVEARDSEKNWYTAEILAGNGARWRVHFNGWDSRWDEWVEAARLRLHSKGQLQVGKTYEVLWEKKWYPAVMTQGLENYFYFAHFLHEAGEDDEWVTAERTRLPRQAQSGAEFQAPPGAPPASVGQWVAAEWHDSWYRAQITGTYNGTFSVHYDDNSDGQVSADGLLPIWEELPLQVGDRVLACCNREGLMTPGRVEQLLGSELQIRWEDGGRRRLPRGRVAPLRRNGR